MIRFIPYLTDTQAALIAFALAGFSAFSMLFGSSLAPIGWLLAATGWWLVGCTFVQRIHDAKAISRQSWDTPTSFSCPYCPDTKPHVHVQGCKYTSSNP